MRDKKQEKTYVEDVSRSVYDIRNEEKDVYRVDEGLTEAIVSQISKRKERPGLDAEFPSGVLKNLQRAVRPRLGPLHRRAGHEQHRHLRPPQHQDERQVVRGPARRSRIRSNALGIPQGRAGIPGRCRCSV